MNELTKAVLSTITSGFIKSSIHSLSSVPICCVIPEALHLLGSLNPSVLYRLSSAWPPLVWKAVFGHSVVFNYVCTVFKL